MNKIRVGRRLWALDIWNGLWTGFYLVWLPSVIISGVVEGASPWYLLLLLVTGSFSLIMMEGAYRRNEVPVTSRLLTQMQNKLSSGDRDYVLYLRSFLVDRRLSGHDPAGGRNFLTTLAGYFTFGHARRLEKPWENRITDLLMRLGRVEAVGRPGEGLPPLGAKRAYLRLAEGRSWQDEVTVAIRGARLVVIVAAIGDDPRTAEGTLWEYAEALRLVPPEQIVLLACGGRDAYDSFRRRAVEYHRTRGNALPRLPDLPPWPEPRRPRMAHNSFPLRGIVRFDGNWAAEFVDFDSTAVRGLTSFARWRRTVRTRVEPWLMQCEDALPGRAVRPMKVRAHWHVKVLLALVVAAVGIVQVNSWDGTLTFGAVAALASLLYVILGVSRFAFFFRDMSRYGVRVRPPKWDKDGDDMDSSFAGYLVNEITARWPGESGIAIATASFYRDLNLRDVDAPRRNFWRMRAWKRPVHLPGEEEVVRVDPLVGRLVSVRLHVIHLLVMSERDAGTTSPQFFQRALSRVIAVIGTVVIFPLVIIFQMHTVGQRLAVGAVGILSLLRLNTQRRRYLRRIDQIFRRPRVPADLLRDPCVLYLRPPADALAADFDLDLRTILTFAGLFRVAYREDMPVPHHSQAWLPIPVEGRLLATALPSCKLVVVPATGSDRVTMSHVIGAVSAVPPSRLLLVIPPGTSDDDYVCFRDATAEAFARHGVALPAVLPVSASAGSEPPLRGAIHFASDWTPTVLAFVPSEEPRQAQLERIREQLRPILDNLPAEAPFDLHAVVAVARENATTQKFGDFGGG